MSASVAYAMLAQYMASELAKKEKNKKPRKWHEMGETPDFIKDIQNMIDDRFNKAVEKMKTETETKEEK